MPFVLDASVVGCWVLPDETHATADRAEQAIAEDTAIVPALWWFEVRNLLLVNERRGRLSEAQTDAALQALSAFDIEVDRAPSESSLLSLSRAHALTVYDASYLELARRQRISLATLDRRLRAAAEAAGVALF